MNQQCSHVDNARSQGFATKAIHAGYDPDTQTGAVNPPIYASSTFIQDGVGGLRNGFEYARTGNPTRTVLESNLASLEGGSYARAFASGMAATDVLLRALLRPSDHIIIPNDAYGGTFRLVDKVFSQWGITYSVASVRDSNDIASKITDNTKIIWLESPTNPLLAIGSISDIAAIAHKAGIVLVVDNTFATPYLQQPLLLGADVVVHSTTKYLAGHSDVIGGALIYNDEKLDNSIAFLQNSAGAVPGPFDAFLTLRGIKTLAVRMRQHCENAAALAIELEKHPAVGKIYYPGLSSHPDHSLAQKQMKYFGGMISIELIAGKDAAQRLCSRTKIFTLAESLGGVESLIEHPASMTHASTTGSLLEVPDNLVRISVGIEDIEDLSIDLHSALDDL